MSLELTIKELIHHTELKITLKAGKSGINRTILWAHTSELEDPSKWVLPHYLIMTTGLGIPENAQKQREYLQYLVDAELAGLIISDHMNAPSDLSALYDMADAIGFPVMMSDYNTPFAIIAKVVSEANKDKKDAINHQLIKVLYEHTRTLIQEHNINDLVNRVRLLLNIEIYLLDITRPNVPPFPDSPYPDEWVDELSIINFSKIHNETHHELIENNGFSCHIIPLKAEDYALVIINQTLNNDLLQNLTLLFSFYIEGRIENFNRLLKQSGEFFDDILHERVNESYIKKRLPNFKIKLERSRILIFKKDPNINYDKFFFNHAIYGITLFQNDQVLMITDNENCDVISQSAIAIGISNPLEDLARLKDALKEARLAYKKSSKTTPIQYYAADSYAKYAIPKSLEDAQKLFDFNLKSLYQQDQDRNTRYLTTLKVFLENDRAWEKSAKILHIHKQTLVYRVQKIHEITGRRTDTMEDMVELWIALKAGEILGLIDDTH